MQQYSVYGSRMALQQSVVYGRIHFLRGLGNVHTRVRKSIVRNMTAGQMEAFAEVVHYVVRGSIPALTRDVSIFREKMYVLRQIADRGISLRRKRNSLLANHALIHRLLRPYYLDSALYLSIRAFEQ
jgi:hypothetical protein